jgi:hypothetical protein
MINAAICVLGFGYVVSMHFAADAKNPRPGGKY